MHILKKIAGGIGGVFGSSKFTRKSDQHDENKMPSPEEKSDPKH